MTGARKIKQRQKRRLASLNTDREVDQTPADTQEQIEQLNTILDSAVESIWEIPSVIASPIRQTVVLSEKALKQDSELLDAVERLISSMDYRAESEKKTGLVGTAKGWATNKVEEIKSMVSLPGLFRMAGVGQDPSSLLGTILRQAEVNQQRKQERAAAKSEYIANFSQLTEVGRGMSKTEALAEGARRFEELQQLETELAALKSKEKRARDFGGSLSESDIARKKALIDKRASLQNYSAEEIKSENPRSKLLDGFRYGVLDEFSTLNQNEKYKFMSQDPATLRDIFRGAMSELVELSDEQLKQLEAINQLLSKSEEDQHEENLKNKLSPVIPTTKVVADKEEEGGLMNLLMGKAKGLLGGVGTKAGGLLKGAGSIAKSGLAKFLPFAAKAALPAAAVAGAGYGGWKLGSWLNENVINPGVSKLTGVEGNTLGGAIFDGVQKVKGWFGSKDAEAAPSPVRVQQMQQLANNERQRAELEAQSNQQNNNPVVNNIADNRSTVVNNSTVMRVPVRNQEPALNRRIERMMSY